MSNYIIDSAEKINYNGNDYYIRIRTENTENPVVLFLHGGCGVADRAFIMKWNSPLAKVCTIVAWDQRGAGIAYDRKKAKTEVLTKELYIDDLNNVVEYLKKRFNKEKIILVGHSFGTELGVWYCQCHPENVECYVGIGQVVDAVKNEELSFNFTLEEARKRHDKKAEKVLLEIGPPVNGFYKDDKMLTQRFYLAKFGGVEYGTYKSSIFIHLPKIPSLFKEYSFKTMLNYLKAEDYCLSQPLGQEKVNFMEEAKELAVPVYLFMGKSDYNTVHDLAKAWFELIEAPFKKFISFDRSGHTPQWEESEKFNQTFAKEVLGKELK